MTCPPGRVHFGVRGIIQVGSENVDVALSLVGFDDEIHNAMKYVFGSTLICKDAESAKKVTFQKVGSRTLRCKGIFYLARDTKAPRHWGSKYEISRGFGITMERDARNY